MTPESYAAQVQPDLWLTFVGATIAISVSPGAGAVQSMATGLNHGLRRGYWSIAGLQIGLMLQLVVVAVGLGAAVAKSLVVFNAIKIVPQGREFTVERFGRYTRTLRPGISFLTPFVEGVGRRINMMEQVLDVPQQEVITKDNVTVRVTAVAYFRVIDPDKAVTEVENFLVATTQIAQTTLRSVLGKAELDSLLAERERLNVELQQIIDEQTEPWGVKVSTVEVKDVEIPANMQRAMARQAEAERERRAKVINAEG